MAYVQNAMRLIERTEVNPRYEIRVWHLLEIFESSESEFDRINSAFQFGSAQGIKAERAARRKAAKA